jgi:hypothetical protein
MNVRVHGFWGAGGTAPGGGGSGAWRLVEADTTVQPGERVYVRSDTLAGDPQWSLVSALLRGDGEHDSAAIVDEKGATVTVTGSAVNTTEVKQLGTGSIHIPSGAYLTLAASTKWDFGTGDFCIEGFVRLDGAPGATYPAVISKGNLSALSDEVWTLETSAGGDLRFFAFHNSYVTPLVQAGAGALSTEEFRHVAVTRSSGTTRLFVDGALIDSSGAAYSVNAGGQLRIGTGWYEPGARVAPGWYDEIRITKGAARYTAAFTPPDAPAPADAVAKLTLGAGSEGDSVSAHSGPGPGVVRVDDGATDETLATDEQRDYVHDGAGWVRL